MDILKCVKRLAAELGGVKGNIELMKENMDTVKEKIEEAKKNIKVKAVTAKNE